MLIILRGLTGSGKSTVAGELAGQYGIVSVDIDDVMKDFPEEKGYHELQSKSFPKAGGEAKKCLDEGKSVLVQYSFIEEAEIDEVLKPTELTLKDPNVRVVRLCCTLDDAYKRKGRGNSLDAEYRKEFHWVPNEILVCTSGDKKQSAVQEIARKLGLEAG